MSEHSTTTAGIDTGKKELHLGYWPKGQRLKVNNGQAGFEVLAKVLAKENIKRVGIESTGTYHIAVTNALRAEGFEVVVLQPGQVKAFGELHRQKAKRDASDAELVAGCAAAQTKVHAPQAPEIAKLAEHLTFIEQLEDSVARLKTQLERYADGEFIGKIKSQIAHQRLAIRHELKALTLKARAIPALARRFDLITSVPGVGPRSALAVVIRMPELGSIERAQAAALLGVAPLDDTSGEHDGQRSIQGGRARARKSLYMAAFSASLHHNPNLKRFYRHLMQRGKPHTLAVIACTRKLVILLNAILERDTPWTDEPPKGRLHAPA